MSSRSAQVTTRQQVIDLNGRYVCPGFIDAHVHIESSLCTPPEFSRTVLAHGVTSVVTDPHEIANVLGIDGIRFMLERAKNGPINVFVMASSCVPATDMETSGARLEAEDLAPLLEDQWVLGLAEMMNYPGVIYGDEGVLDKLDLFKDRVLDGHSPAVRGKPLNAYVAAGINSDHECTTVDEAREKLRLGLTIFIREGTTTHNLRPLLPLIDMQNYSRLCFCTDDRVPASLIDEGSIDHMVRVAIASGVDPITAIRLGTINTANYFRLHHLGAVAPGRRADLIVFSDLHDLRAEQVYRGGVLMAENGHVIAPKPPLRPVRLRPSMNVTAGTLDLSISGARQADSRHRRDGHPGRDRPFSRRRQNCRWRSCLRPRTRHSQNGRHRAPSRQRQNRQSLHQRLRPQRTARWRDRSPTIITIWS